VNGAGLNGATGATPLAKTLSDVSAPPSSFSAANRLATYGTLAPGRVNYGQLQDLNGRWLQGTVTGRLVQAGWGATLGFPGLILDPAGEEVAVHLFESADLPDHWDRLDAFEGDAYRRILVPVRTRDGILDSFLYEIVPAPAGED